VTEESSEDVKAGPGLKARHPGIFRNGNGQNTVYALQEPIAAYNFDFEVENKILRTKNRFLLAIFDDILVGCIGPTPDNPG
jgi:hypothetical protein